MNEDDLWDLSDEDLEAAFKEAKASSDSPDTEIEQENENLDTSNDGDSEEQIEEIDNGSEKPEDELEDSDHDTSDNSEDEDVDKDTENDSDEEDPDKDSTEDETDSESTDEDEDELQPDEAHKFRANGKDYEFSPREIVEQFPRIFGQAMDYTKKMQAIKPWRKTIDAIEGAELSHDDVSLMIDVLKGDKEAITEVLQRTGVDTLDLDTGESSNYTAKDYGRDDSVLAIKDIVDDISRDTEYATTHSILSEEWDDKSWNSMTENPEMIRLLHTDVKSGMYKTLQPIAEKLKVFDGSKQSDLDYYKQAAQTHFTQVAKQNAIEEQRAEKVTTADKLAEVKAKTAKRDSTKKASVKRKAAAPTKSVTQGRDVVDYLDESDENFDEWYKQLQEKM